MEKALLKVTRFNSTDVIATSGETETCNHTKHYKVKKKDENYWYAVEYDNAAKKWSDSLTRINDVLCPAGVGEGSILTGDDGTLFSFCDKFKP